MREERKQLVAKHLAFYQELTSGRRQPETLAQRHFVDVFKGMQPPQTEHEWAYWEHLSEKAGAERPARPKPKPQPKKRMVVRSEADGLSAKDREIRDKFMPKKTRVVTETWGSRDDWKADSGANWSSSRKNRVTD